MLSAGLWSFLAGRAACVYVLGLLLACCCATVVVLPFESGVWPARGLLSVADLMLHICVL